MCIDEVAEWMRTNRLQLNSSRTDVLWCASSRRQHQIPQTPLPVCTDFIQSISSVRDLGIYLDSDASVMTHVSRTESSCFGVLRQIWSIRRSVMRQVLLLLVTALILSKLDYSNATLAGESAVVSDERNVFLARKHVRGHHSTA